MPETSPRLRDSSSQRLVDVVLRKQERQRETQDLAVGKGVRNDVLWRAIFDRYSSVDQFCRAILQERHIPIDPGAVQRLLRGETSLYLGGEQHWRNAKYRPVCIVLAEVLGIAIEELFPKYAYGGDPRGPREIPLSQLEKDEAKDAHVRPTQARSPLEDIIHTEDLQHLKEQLPKLKKIDQKIIREHFGIREGTTNPNKKPLDFISEQIGLSPAATRQRKHRTIKQLREFMQSEK